MIAGVLFQGDITVKYKNIARIFYVFQIQWYVLEYRNTLRENYIFLTEAFLSSLPRDIMIYFKHTDLLILYNMLTCFWKKEILVD